MTACVAQWESGRLKILRLRFDSSHRHFLGHISLICRGKGLLHIRRVRGASRKWLLGFPVFCGGLLENYIIGILNAEEISQLWVFPLYFQKEIKKGQLRWFLGFSSKWWSGIGWEGYVLLGREKDVISGWIITENYNWLNESRCGPHTTKKLLLPSNMPAELFLADRFWLQHFYNNDK